MKKLILERKGGQGTCTERKLPSACPLPRCPQQARLKPGGRNSTQVPQVGGRDPSPRAVAVSEGGSALAGSCSQASNPGSPPWDEGVSAGNQNQQATRLAQLQNILSHRIAKGKESVKNGTCDPILPPTPLSPPWRSQLILLHPSGTTPGWSTRLIIPATPRWARPHLLPS